MCTQTDKHNNNINIGKYAHSAPIFQPKYIGSKFIDSKLEQFKNCKKVNNSILQIIQMK